MGFQPVEISVAGDKECHHSRNERAGGACALQRRYPAQHAGNHNIPADLAKVRSTDLIKYATKWSAVSIKRNIVLDFLGKSRLTLRAGYFIALLRHADRFGKSITFGVSCSQCAKKISLLPPES